MNVLLIGGTRFIGHAAASALVAAGHQVTVLHRGVHPAEVPGVTAVVVDRADAAALRAAAQAQRPDVVIDTWAMTKRDAETTVAAIQGMDTAVVVLSSQDVYAQFGRLNGLPAPAPEAVVTEDSPLTVPYPFGELGGHSGGDEYDKKEVEVVFKQAVDTAVPGAVVLRLPATVGERDGQRRFGSIVDALDDGVRAIPQMGGGAWRWTHGHVNNMAHAIRLCAEARLQGFHVFNVGEAHTPTMHERVERLAHYMDVALEWVEVEDELPPAFGALGVMANDVVVSSAKLRAALGYAEVLSERQYYDNVLSWLRKSCTA